MNQKPLLPLYEDETPEEKAARLRRIKEIRDAQPHPSDDPCTALSKWLARNSQAIGTFGFVGAMLVGMRELHQASLVTQDVSDLSLQPNQGQNTDDTASTFAREMDLAEARRQLAVNDAPHAPNGQTADLSNQLNEEEHTDDAKTNLLNHHTDLTGNRALLGDEQEPIPVAAASSSVVYSLADPGGALVCALKDGTFYNIGGYTKEGTLVKPTGEHRGGADGDQWWEIVSGSGDEKPLGWIQHNVMLQAV